MGNIQRSSFGVAHSRRSFLQAASLALGAASSGGLAPSAFAATESQRAGPRGARPFKISLAQGSLHKEFAASRMDPLDFAKVANGLGLDAIEYASQFYKGKASDKSYLAELKRRAAGEGVWGLLIRVQAEGDLGAAEEKGRRRTVDNHKKWVEAAAFLGCHAIAVKAGGQGSEDEQAKRVSDGLRGLCEFSDPYGISVLAENDGGLSSKGSWLADVLNAVGHKRCGSSPSFGDLPPGAEQEGDRYQGVRQLMPLARALSATSYDFDARGDETRINYPLMLKIVTDAGYHGYVGIQYAGQRLSEHAGIERTKSLLERVRHQLSVRAERRG